MSGVSSLSFPIALSLEVALVAVLALAVPGTLLGYTLARKRFPGRTLLDGLVILPLVLPPSVMGYLLLLVLGRGGVVGGPLFRATGLSLPFTFWAAVIAAFVVALPLFAKTAQAAFSQVAPELEETAWSLGLSPLRTFLVVTLPLGRRGLIAAAVLAFARAAGEFGATLIFAGNIPGRTNTMSLELYSAFQAGDDHRALVLVALLSSLSLGVVLVSNHLGRDRIS